MTDAIVATVKTTDKHFNNTYTSLPVLEAIKEIIFNALDADATQVDVVFKEDVVHSSVQEVIVKDNGTGIKFPDQSNADDSFLSLGYSEKKMDQTNSFNRLVHGKKGEGRFKGLSLGNLLEWKSKTSEGTHKIKLNINSPQQLQLERVNDIPEILSPTGTVFVAYANGKSLNFQLQKNEKYNFERIMENIRNSLEGSFLTILQDPRISITLNGKKLSVAEHISHYKDSVLPAPNSDVKVKTIIWDKSSKDNNRIFWCDSSFNTLLEERLDDTKDKTDSSLYIAADRIVEAHNNNTLKIGDFSPELAEIKNQAKQIQTSVLIEHKKHKSEDIIAYLKSEEIYPYAEDEAVSGIEKHKRDIFDEIIIKLNEKKPILFKRKQKQIRRGILDTLKVIIEKDPQNFQVIIEKLAGITSEEAQELANLLNRTSFSSIIQTSSEVFKRLDFLEGLRQIAYGDYSNIKERSQLHKIVETQTWIFGEQFRFMASDKSFNTIVAEMRKKEGYFQDVDRIQGGNDIPDLFFAQFGFEGETPKALIVELKRPSVKIGMDEMNQIKKYYNTIKANPQFKDYQMDIIVVSSDVKEEAKGDIEDERTGKLSYSSKTPDKRLYVRSWSDIINKNAASLDKMKQLLNANVDKQDGVNFLQDNYAHILNKK